jgi:circadian clock protein KaiB
MIKPEEHKEVKNETKGSSTFEYVLRLFISGATPNSLRAIGNIKHICETHIKGKYSLEIIDVYQQGKIAQREQLVALPLLMKKKPLPERKLVGDMSNTEKVLKGLGIIS